MRKKEMIKRICKLESSANLYVKKGYDRFLGGSHYEIIPINVIIDLILNHFNLEIKHSPESTKLQTIKKAK